MFLFRCALGQRLRSVLILYLHYSVLRSATPVQAERQKYAAGGAGDGGKSRESGSVPAAAEKASWPVSAASVNSSCSSHSNR